MQTPYTNIYLIAALLLLLPVWGCSASRESRQEVGDWTSDCARVAGEIGDAFDSVKVVVDFSGAGVVRSDNQVQAYKKYSRLLYLDCKGAYQPAAATSWTAADAGKTWIFNLREDLIDAEGENIDAPALALYYRMSRDKPYNVSVEALAPYQLAISFNRGYDKLPPVLLADKFEVPVADDSGVTLAWLDVDEDVRDLMESDVDAVITTDPEIIAYAGLRSEWTAFPLAWDRAYVMFIGAQENKPQTLPSSVLEDLALGVSSPDIRQHAQDNFWASSADCASYLQENASSIGNPGPEYDQVVADHYSLDPYLLSYSAQDGMTRTLAERIVALSSGAIDIEEVGTLQRMMQFDGSERRWVAHETDIIARTGLKPIHATVDVLPLVSMSRCEDVLSFYASGLARLMRLKTDQHLLFLPLLDVRPRILVRDKRLRVVQDARHVMFLSASQRRSGDES